jgi:sirohydrochlorin ferrochelatase
MVSRDHLQRLEQLARGQGCTLGEMGVVVVDHGSRREESNRLLLDVVQMLRVRGPFSIVEPAHMELAEPSLRTAFLRCATRGARLVVVSPFFLLPGQHWTEDIPTLASAVAAEHPGVKYLVAGPLGVHPLLVDVLLERIEELAAKKHAP